MQKCFNKRWFDIPNYKGYYQISKSGKIKSLDRYVPSKNNTQRLCKGQLLKSKIDRYGYVCVTLTKEGKRKYWTVHRLVALTFISNPKHKPSVNHKKGNKLNNHYLNLEWTTVKENNDHAIKTGLMKGRKGMKHHGVKLTEKQVLEIRSLKNITYAEIGRRYNLSETYAHDILKRKTWIHI